MGLGPGFWRQQERGAHVDLIDEDRQLSASCHHTPLPSHVVCRERARLLGRAQQGGRHQRQIAPAARTVAAFIPTVAAWVPKVAAWLTPKAGRTARSCAQRRADPWPGRARLCARRRRRPRAARRSRAAGGRGRSSRARAGTSRRRTRSRRRLGMGRQTSWVSGWAAWKLANPSEAQHSGCTPATGERYGG